MFSKKVVIVCTKAEILSSNKLKSSVALAGRAPCSVVDLSPLATQIGNPASAKGVISVTRFPNKILYLI